MTGWMPIGLWALHRYGAGGSWRTLAVFTVAFLLQGMSNLYYLYFYCLPVTVVALVALIRAPRPRLRMAIEFGVALLVIAAVTAPVVRAYYDARRDRGLVRSAGEIRVFSADVSSYVHVSPSLAVWGGVLRTGRAERELFAGATVLGLTVVGLAAWRRRRPDQSGNPLLAPPLVYAAIGGTAFVLSLGPQPTAWGETLMSTGPYGWLLAIAPGLDGLRVVARFSMVVFLAVSVLAGLGVARFLPWLSSPARAGLGLLLIAAVLAEGYRGPMPYEALEPRLQALESDAAYGWLADQPPGGVLELPVRGREPYHSLLFQYRTLQHRHPIVNGYSGYDSALVVFLRGPASPLHSRAETNGLIRGLRLVGVRYLVVHERLFDDPLVWTAMLSAIREQRDQVEQVRTFGAATVIQLRPASQVPTVTDLREIPRTAFQASASRLEDRLELAFDGDVDTRWDSGEPQSGDEWLELRFDRPYTVSRVRLDLADDILSDYPRRLRIDSSTDGEHFETVYEDDILPQVVVGVTRRARPVPIDIDLPPTTTTVLRLRQLRKTERWYWSVNELTVWQQ